MTDPEYVLRPEHRPTRVLVFNAVDLRGAAHVTIRPDGRTTVTPGARPENVTYLADNGQVVNLAAAITAATRTGGAR
jgi:hypothetical protein